MILQLPKTWGCAGPIKFSQGSGSLREGKGWPKPPSLLERGMQTSGTSVYRLHSPALGGGVDEGKRALLSQSFYHPPSVWKTRIAVLGD